MLFSADLCEFDALGRGCSIFAGQLNTGIELGWPEGRGYLATAQYSCFAEDPSLQRLLHVDKPAPVLILVRLWPNLSAEQEQGLLNQSAGDQVNCLLGGRPQSGDPGVPADPQAAVCLQLPGGQLMFFGSKKHRRA